MKFEKAIHRMINAIAMELVQVKQPNAAVIRIFAPTIWFQK